MIKYKGILWGNKTDKRSEKMDLRIQMEDLLQKYKEKIRFIGAKSEQVRQVREIISNRRPNPENLFVAEGIWSHMKITQLSIPVRSFIFCPPLIYSAESIEILAAMLRATDNVYAVSERVFSTVSDRDRMDGFISICAFKNYQASDLRLSENSIIVVLDGLENPGNIGTISRTCDGANVDAIFLCNKRPRLTHPKLIKGSMGAVFVIPFVEFDDVTDCIKWLTAHGFTIYIADTRAEKHYHKFAYTSRSALIVGSERYGIDKAFYTPDSQLLSIPMLGVCDSLNVGVAASIIVYDMSTKLGKQYH